MKSVRFNVLLVACLFISAATFTNADALLLWEDLFDLAGLSDAARAVAITSNRAVVVGEGTTASGANPIIRAYDTRTGTLEWSDEAPGFFPGVVSDDHSAKCSSPGVERGCWALTLECALTMPAQGIAFGKPRPTRVLTIMCKRLPLATTRFS